MERNSLYIKIAHWYYNLGMTQDEIAKRLSYTRQRVNRIISSLADMGIVTIKVNGYEQGNVKYETLIEEHFGLKQVIVADSYGESDNYLPSLASVAAQYLDDYIQPKMTIGVSWGITLAETIARLSYSKKNDCMVVQMVGAQNFDKDILKSDQIARALSEKLDCACYMLYAPVVVDHPETKAMLMAEKSIKKSFEHMKRCDLAVFGVGQLTPDSTMYKRGLLKEEDIQELREEGFRGDICLNPIRLDGTWDNCFIKDRIITVGMEVLKQIPNVVAIAGGEDKTEAIISCLKSKCISTLIIDDATAKRMVATLNLI
ncbi:sugar-binding transcriptional regulator [Acetobacterium bakii]|uniref:Transcriptional regulator n=1 Tax=Acetobacterium bakii TaxID=52689 RepID=A0A0L6U2F0_9FIRM|nr:sugar-binding transcriptional regulator [Acetobacterium bakii]KNZ41960.1 transcriptional regulator [Acetobacterium bakii]